MMPARDLRIRSSGLARTAARWAAVLLLAACSTKVDDAALGRQAAARSDFKTALIHYKNALEASGADPGLRLAYAEVLEKSGDFPAAEQQLRRAVELGASRDEWLPRIAMWQLDRGDVRVLVRDFQNIELKAPAANRRLHALLALAWLQQGRVADAEKALLGSDAPDAATQLARTQILGLKRDLPAMAVAAREVRTLLERDPDPGANWWIWRGLARLSLTQGKADQAIEDFKKARQAMPSHFGIVGEMGEAYLALGRIDEARREQVSLSAMAPTYYRTVLLDAMLKAHDGDWDGAYERAVKVLARVPESPAAGLLAASIDIRRNNLATAEGRLAQVIKEQPSSVEALRLLASVAARRGDFVAADRILASALNRAPDQSGLLIDSAELDASQGQWTRARERALRALSLNPRSVRMHALLADLEARSNKGESARLHFDRALDNLDAEPAMADQLFRQALRLKLADRAELLIRRESAKRPDDPMPILWRAIAARDKGDVAKGTQLVLQALDKKKDFYPALSILRGIHAGAGLEKVYGDRLQAALSARTRDERIALDMIHFQQAKGAAPDKVLDLARDLLADFPDSVRLRQALSERLLAMGKPGQADEVINRGLSDFSRTPGMQALGAAWAERTGKSGLALDRYTALSAAYPENAAFLVKRSQLLVLDRRPDEAIKVLEQALKLRPEDESINRELALLLRVNARLPDALKLADQWAALPNREIDGLLLKADLYALAGKFAEAEQVIAQVQRKGGGERAVYAQVALLDARNRQADADKLITAWLARNPRSSLVLNQALVRAMRSGQGSAALGYLETMLQSRPGDPILLNEKALLLARLRQPGASETARRALEAMPDQPRILDTLAFSLRQEGRIPEAILTYRQALALAPAMNGTRMDLAQTLIEHNERSQAGQVLAAIDAASLKGAAAERLKVLRAQTQ